MGNLCSITISTEDTVSRCWNCITERANYTCKLEKNLRALSVALGELKALRDDVHRRVECAEQQQMIKRLSQVQMWLSRVETVVMEAEELIKDGSKETGKLCMAGYFSKNCRSSYKFGRRVATKLKEIVELKKKGVFDKVAENEPTTPVLVRPAEPTVGLESTLTKVWTLLQDKSVGMIGLYGLGGVGKTTLLTQINNKLSTAGFDFDLVIWVVVSKDHTVENVQEKIGKRIGLLNELMANKSSDERAVDIFRILNKKKFVVLLDDVWERVHLTKIGIPLPSQDNGSKVVFTTRFLEICNEMQAQKIKVDCLRANEAWKLFREKVGEETLNSHPDIPELAKKLAEKCGGLPLALITIGRAMASKKTPQAWEYAVEVLKKSAHKLARMEQEVYPLLKFSFDSLHCDTMRTCLLYCCLYPEDVLILKSELIEYWFCEGLLDEFDNVIRARLQGYSIIDSLVNACLLEEEGEYYLKMHDVIRDMTLWIACESEAAEKSFFVQAGLQLTDTPDAGKWENVRRISLIGNKIKYLTETPTCPNLQTLLLNYNELEVISDGFFKFMPNLRVLNLAGNRGLSELPEGISELVSLECLNLSRTGITELPIKMKCLAKLKYLDLRYTDVLRRIPRKLISSFSKLQIFRMFRSGTGAPVDHANEMDQDIHFNSDNDDAIVELECLQHLKRPSNGFHNPNETDEDNLLNDGNEGLVQELGCLQYLNMLSIHIRSAFALERFLSFRNLECCTQELSLCVFKETKLLNVLSLANMERLERLDVSECGSMEEMKMVSELGEGRMIQTSLFPTLREVTIFECGNLRDMTWIILVPNLRILWVVNCAKMEEIMSEEKLSEVANVVINLKPNPFSKLQNLGLQFLPQLKSIYWDALPFPCLTEIVVRECPKLGELPVNAESAKGNQICIQGEKEWWERLEWKDKATQNAYLPFFEPQ
ncbi:probable disease resistance protein At1g12280 [Durio zibethinus]|uniref:Probable disease resistance protein At1g12280 n=1 Tax=Durio zibethinus TaxID=66656 RepID=A0A6P6BJ35_DURZI|nr:probable disease resistance protein At1g12280 [Durio zibethinus]